jgi:hypothetical protein
MAIIAVDIAGDGGVAKELVNFGDMFLDLPLPFRSGLNSRQLLYLP